MRLRPPFFFALAAAGLLTSSTTLFAIQDDVPGVGAVRKK